MPKRRRISLVVIAGTVVLAGLIGAIALSLDQQTLAFIAPTIILSGLAIWQERRSHQISSEVRAATEHIDEMMLERWAYLAESSQELGSSLDYPTTIEKGARLLVPDFASECLIEVTDKRGFVTRGYCRMVPGKLKPESGVSSDVLPMPEGIRGSSRLSVPLRSRNLILGTLTLIQSKPGFRYQVFHEQVVQAVASRAAAAIDNARLYLEAQNEIHGRERLLAVISHDLKNPLTVIDYSLQFMLSRPYFLTPDASRELDLVHKMRSEVKRMDQFIHDLLDVDKIRSGTFNVFPVATSLGEILDRALEPALILARAKEIEIRSQRPGSDIRVLADARSLPRVFSNILGNAIKFSPAKTLIQIQVEADSEFVTLSVLDQGPGIPESDLENIFKDYWQAKETSQLGAGLGLPIVKGIVEEHGGRVWAERRDEGGTVLRFTLPREA